MCECSSCNPQHTSASNLAVSASIYKLVLALTAMLLLAPIVQAKASGPRGERLVSGPAPSIFLAFAGNRSARGTDPASANLLSQQRVRASLKAALTPDPLSMGALLFCIFALRWMRVHQEQQQISEAQQKTALPGAA